MRPIPRFGGGKKVETGADAGSTSGGRGGEWLRPRETRALTPPINPVGRGGSRGLDAPSSRDIR
jgi:hypothetical protein